MRPSRHERPFWWPEFAWPKTETLVAAGLFALSWRILEILAAQPKLSDNQGFMFLAQSIVVSGLIAGAVAFYFSASKTGTQPGATAQASEPGTTATATATVAPTDEAKP